MSTTIKILCYKSKTLANGESPLMLCICKDRKRKYQSLGISINPEFWDFKKNEPKPNSPNKDLIQKIILDKKIEFQTQVLEYRSEDKDYTASTLIANKKRTKTKTVADFYNELINELRLSDRIGNARVYQDSFSSLKRFAGNLDIPFADIDVIFLKRYEKWLRENRRKETTISTFFRTLRSVFNKAIEAKHIKAAIYPFHEFKISKFDTTTEKRAIRKEDVRKIMNLDLMQQKEYMRFSQDLFTFSYLCGGINFADMANLRHSNIIDGRLVYLRQKTGKRINMPLSPEAYAIINKYKGASKGYIFPVLDDNTHITEEQKYNRRKKVLKRVNYNLKAISKITGLKMNLSTYVARHSFATVLKRSGVNIALISEALGHSDLATTQIYLDSFENSQIDAAMANLL